MPDPVLSAVHQAGILDAVVPTSLGGSGLGLAALCDATRVLAHGCPASNEWCGRRIPSRPRSRR